MAMTEPNHDAEPPVTPTRKTIDREKARRLVEESKKDNAEALKELEDL